MISVPKSSMKASRSISQIAEANIWRQSWPKVTQWASSGSFRSFQPAERDKSWPEKDKSGKNVGLWWENWLRSRTADPLQVEREGRGGAGLQYFHLLALFWNVQSTKQILSLVCNTSKCLLLNCKLMCPSLNSTSRWCILWDISIGIFVHQFNQTLQRPML